MSAETRPRVLILDEAFEDASAEVAAQFPALELVCGSKGLANDKQAFDGVISQFEPIDKALLDELESPQVILKMGQNYYNIDADEVRSRALTLAAVPRKGPNCVAELAITLMLALSKDLLMSHASVAEGAYRYRGLRPERSEQWKMAFHWMRHMRLHEVRGKRLGIVGMGEIACEAALRAKALGMSIRYYKRNPLSEELERRFSARYQGLEDLLKESDYVLLAVPHTEETEKMIGANELALMKPEAYLVNICRGGVVDEAALVEALTKQSIAGAGLDVFEFEPLPADSPLCDLHNVILTPHVGGGTGSNRGLELGEALTEMTRLLAGEPPTIDLS